MSSPLATYQVKVPKIVWSLPPVTPVIDTPLDDVGWLYLENSFAHWTVGATVHGGSEAFNDAGILTIQVPCTDCDGHEQGHIGPYFFVDIPDCLPGVRYTVTCDFEVTGITSPYAGAYDIGLFQPGGSMQSVPPAGGAGSLTLTDVPRFGGGTVFRVAVGWAFLAYYTVGSTVTSAFANIVFHRPDPDPEHSEPPIVHTLEFGYPMSKARSWTAPSDGSDRVRYPSGAETAWIDEEDGLLEGTVFHIPAEDDETPFAPISGWNGPDGWQAFLEFAWAGHPFAFWKDRTNGATAKTCQLLAPRDPPQIGPASTRRLTLRLRTADASRMTGY